MSVDHRQGGEKVALATEKLQLETLLLQRKLSWHGRLLPWVQASSFLAALAGAFVAFLIGINQLSQGANNQAADRFDKALTRIASVRPDERMAGVYGLNLFLRTGTQLLQEQALVFLVNTLSLETDERVQNAILDVLADLPTGAPSQAVLDEGLRIAVQRNRGLAVSVVEEWPKRIVERQKKTLAKFNLPDADLEPLKDDIPVKILAALSTDQYLELIEAEQGPFAGLDRARAAPLTGLGKAIQVLIKRGAVGTDFKQIYCEDCSFAGSKFPDRANFERAYLVNADFTHAKLPKASFYNADLGGAIFFDADLTGADMRVDRFAMKMAGKFLGNLLPQLDCAKLSGADLSGQPLLFIVKRFDTWSEEKQTELKLPALTSAQLDRTTKLDSFSIVTVMDITDDYLRAHETAPETRPLTTDRLAGWDNPVLKDQYLTAAFRRMKGTFSIEVSKYTSTMAFSQLTVTADDLADLKNDAFALRWYIDQPALRVLPLYSQFVAAVNALSIPKVIDDTVAKTRSDEAAKAWAELKPSSCSGDPVYGLFEASY